MTGNIWAFASAIQIPRLSLEEVDAYLGSCARPANKEGSLVWLQPQKAPPRWQPRILHMVKEVGQSTPTGRMRVPSADWEKLRIKLRTEAATAIVSAEYVLSLEQDPSATDLASAPLFDSWLPGDHSWHGPCLTGRVHDDPDWGPRRLYTTTLLRFEPDQGWARTRDALYRLGRRVHATAIDDHRKPKKLYFFHECGDEEVRLALLSEKARVKWQLEQLIPPRA